MTWKYPDLWPFFCEVCRSRPAIPSPHRNAVAGDSPEMIWLSDEHGRRRVMVCRECLRGRDLTHEEDLMMVTAIQSSGGPLSDHGIGVFPTSKMNQQLNRGLAKLGHPVQLLSAWRPSAKEMSDGPD